MIVNRIYQWGREQPDKAALIHNGATLSYGTFARMIEARRRYFSSKECGRSGAPNCAR